MNALLPHLVLPSSWQSFSTLILPRMGTLLKSLDGVERRGPPAPAVPALAGHADLATTERYSHVARPDLEAAIARLGAP